MDSWLPSDRDAHRVGRENGGILEDQQERDQRGGGATNLGDVVSEGFVLLGTVIDRALSSWPLWTAVAIMTTMACIRDMVLGLAGKETQADIDIKMRLVAHIKELAQMLGDNGTPFVWFLGGATVMLYLGYRFLQRKQLLRFKGVVRRAELADDPHRDSSNLLLTGESTLDDGILARREDDEPPEGSQGDD